MVALHGILQTLMKQRSLWKGIFQTMTAEHFKYLRSQTLWLQIRFAIAAEMGVLQIADEIIFDSKEQFDEYCDRVAAKEKELWSTNDSPSGIPGTSSL